MRAINYLLTGFILLVLVGCSSGESGGKSSGGQSETQPKPDAAMNKAALGPLSGATINAYKLADLSKALETTVAKEDHNNLDEAGSFTLSLPGVDDNEWILVSATGGIDIDANDDGIVDEVPTENLGTIHLLAQAGDIRKGSAFISLVSDLVYRYIAEHESDLSLLTQDEMLQAIQSLAQIYLDDINQDNIVNYKDVLAFNPQIHTSSLLIKESLKQTLLEQIHQGETHSASDSISLAISQLVATTDTYKSEDAKVTLRGDRGDNLEYLLTLFDTNNDYAWDKLEYLQILEGYVLRVTGINNGFTKQFRVNIDAGENHYSLTVLSDLWPTNTDEATLNDFISALPLMSNYTDNNEIILNIDKALYASHSQAKPIVTVNGLPVIDESNGVTIIDDDPVLSLGTNGLGKNVEVDHLTITSGGLMYGVVSEPIHNWLDWGVSLDDEIHNMVLNIVGPSGWAVSTICDDNHSCELGGNALNDGITGAIENGLVGANSGILMGAAQSLFMGWVNQYIDDQNPAIRIQVNSLLDFGVVDGDETQASEFMPIIAYKAPHLGSFGFGAGGQLTIRLKKLSECSVWEAAIDAAKNMFGGGYCEDQIIAEWDNLIFRSPDKRPINGSHWHNQVLDNDQVALITTQKGIYLPEGRYKYEVYIDTKYYSKSFTVVPSTPSNYNAPMIDFSYTVSSNGIAVDASASKGIYGGALEYGWDVDGDGVIDLVTVDPVTSISVDTSHANYLTLTLREANYGQTSTSRIIPEYQAPDTDTGTDTDTDTDTSIPDTGTRYTKVSISGQPLMANANEWSCVFDHTSGLMWEVKTNSNDLHGTHHRYTFNEAINYGDLVNAQSFCGHNDWRLPSRSELEGILDPNRISPAIDTTYFPNTHNTYYWSSPINDDLSGIAWAIFFFNGGVVGGDRNSGLSVRLVRGGQ